MRVALLSGRLHAGPAGPAQLGAATSSVRVVTWNVAAINNNPFEYWITHDEDPSYDSMMQAVRLFVEEDPVRGPSAPGAALHAAALTSRPSKPSQPHELNLHDCRAAFTTYQSMKCSPQICLKN